MKRKLINVFVLMGIITTTVSAIPLNIQNTFFENTTATTVPVSTRIIQHHPTLFEWGVDQQQTETCGLGIVLTAPLTFAQAFIPTKNKLTAVRLNIFKYGTPPTIVHLTVSIRDNLTGPDLTTKTIDTSLITIPKNNWILFDFQDISLTPGTTYYIICSGDAGNDTNAWCWFFNNEDTYPNGEAWVKPDENSPWSNFTHGGLNPDDFCFKTYFRKPLGGSTPLPDPYQIHPWIQLIFKRLPYAFPSLRQILDN